MNKIIIVDEVWSTFNGKLITQELIIINGLLHVSKSAEYIEKSNQIELIKKVACKDDTLVISMKEPAMISKLKYEGYKVVPKNDVELDASVYQDVINSNAK